MTPNAIEFGEQHPDGGWQRRVSIDKLKMEFQIEFFGEQLIGHPRDIEWLIEALTKADSAVYGGDSR